PRSYFSKSLPPPDCGSPAPPALFLSSGTAGCSPQPFAPEPGTPPIAPLRLLVADTVFDRLDHDPQRHADRNTGEIELPGNPLLVQVIPSQARWELRRPQ